jgi:hypothetical protein
MNTRLVAAILPVLVFFVAPSIFAAPLPAARAISAPQPPVAGAATAFNSVAPMDTAIEPLGHIGGGIRTAISSGTLGYLLEGNTLTIADLSVPTQTLRLSQLPLPINSYSSLEVSGNLAYVTLGVRGLQIVDVSDPAHPRLRGRFTNDPPQADPELGATKAVEIIDTVAYAVSGANGLQLIDVSDPDHPALVRRYNLSAQRVQVLGHLAYVDDWLKSSPHECRVIDVSDARHPVGVDALENDCPSLTPDHLVYKTLANTLQVYDYSDLHNPILRSTYTMPWAAHIGYLVDGRVYLVDNNHNLHIVQLEHNPDNLIVLGSLRIPAEVRSVQVIGDRAYITLAHTTLGLIDIGVLIVDVSNPIDPVSLNSLTTFGYAQDLQIVGNLAYIAGGAAPSGFAETHDVSNGRGLQIVDISDPTNPIATARSPTALPTHGVQVREGTAYLAAGESGLQIVDVTNPVSPTLLGESQVLSDVLDVQVVGNLAYALGCAAPGCRAEPGIVRLAILDVSDPAHPALQGSADFMATRSYQVQTVQVAGSTAYIAAGVDGLKIVDVADPSQPHLAGSYASWITDVQVAGQSAYLVQAARTAPCCDIALIVADVSNPAAPAELSRLVFYQDDPSQERLRIAGNFAYVSANGLAIIDVTDANHPVPRYYQPTFSGGRIDIAGDLVYTAGDGGLTILRVHPERFLARALLPRRLLLPAVRK